MMMISVELEVTVKINGQNFDHLVQPLQLFFDQSLLKKDGFSFIMYVWT
jgi:hypothetical protein